MHETEAKGERTATCPPSARIAAAMLLPQPPKPPVMMNALPEIFMVTGKEVVRAGKRSDTMWGTEKVGQS